MNRTTLFIVIALGFSSCGKVMPGAFWQSFKNEFIKEDVNQQGAYGGHLAMHWISKQKNTFSSTEVIRFATDEGWQLVDSLKIPSNKLTSWVYKENRFFPLDYSGFSISPSYQTVYKYFPRWINADLKVYTFKTGWIIIEPDTDNSIEVNGFVVLENEGKEMSVYHLWGE